MSRTCPTAWRCSTSRATAPPTASCRTPTAPGPTPSGGWGCEPGDTVVTMLPNSFVAFEAWLGVAWLGAIEVPVNNAYLGDMLRYLLNDSRAAVLVISRALRRPGGRRGRATSSTCARSWCPTPSPATTCPALPFDVLDRRPLLRRAPPRPTTSPGPAHHDTARADLHLRHHRARRRACWCRGPSSTSSPACRPTG